MIEYFVIDKRSNTIINCVTTSDPDRQQVLERFEDFENLRLDPDPPLDMLLRYRYWNERP